VLLDRHRDLFKYWSKFIKQCVKSDITPCMLVCKKDLDKLGGKVAFNIVYPGMTHAQAAQVLKTCLQAVTQKAVIEESKRIVIPNGQNL